MDRDQTDAAGALLAALYRILAGIARIALARGIPYEAIAEVTRRAFVDVARKEFRIAGRKQSVSRVSVLTGIHRKSVARLLAARTPSDEAAVSRITCAAAVVAGWRRDRRYADAKGTPALLPFTGAGPSFSELVRRHGRGDLPARAVLDELLRIGAAERTRGGRIRIAASAYVPQSTSSEAVAILGTDVADLIAAIDHNLAADAEEKFFQRKVAYDNVPTEAMEKIRERVEHAGARTLVELDRTIAKHDRDANPKAGGTGRKRLMVGIYYFEEDVPED
jgi:hypothetical protein